MIFGSPFSNHGFLVLSSSFEKKLYGWGSNKNGELGMNNLEDKFKLTVNNFFTGNSIKNICCGLVHSLFLLRDNTIYSTGDNKFGQLCLKKDKNLRNTVIPQKISIFDQDGEEMQCEIEKIFVGSNHSVFISKTMEVFAGGCNLKGQLGLGDTIERYTATKIFFKEKIIHATCGRQFTFFISINGNIYGCGGNGQTCQLCLDNNSEDVLVPVLIPILQKRNIVWITSGDVNSFFFSTNNDVYINLEDDTIVEDFNLKMIYVKENSGGGIFLISSTPSLKNEKIRNCRLGNDHFMFSTFKKRILLMGGNSCGQIGSGDTKEYDFPQFFTPKILEKMDIVQSLFLHSTSLFFTKDSAWGCGDSISGQLFGFGSCKGSDMDTNENIQKLGDLKVEKFSLRNIEDIQERFEFLKSFFIPHILL